MQLDLAKGSRSRLLAMVMLIIMAVFVVRLFYLQVIRHDFYVAAAQKEQLRQLVIPAARGEIYAMDAGKPVKIVMNETVYTVFADPKIIKDSQPIIDVIQRVAGGNARPNLSKLLEQKQLRYQVLATKVTLKQAEMIKKENLSGVGFQKETQRVYPEGALAAQTLGYVNFEGTGQYGIEGALNDRLTGKDGLLQTVADVRDVPLTIGKENIHTPEDNGDNIVMTIDRNIQSYTEKALADGLQRSGATNGSALVMDPQTGKVLAMANLPTYSPAKYNEVMDAAAFNNDTISAPFEPGSDIKTLTMAIGLDKGVVEPDSTYNNTDFIKVQDRTISNATKGQTGNITYQKALNYSLNTGFVTIAQKLGDGKSINSTARETIYDYFHNKFGLGVLTDIELANEAKGTIVPPDEVGAEVRYSNMSFGQGMDVTMVQVCAAFSTIINGGTYHSPTVIEGVMSDDGFKFDPAAPKGSRPNVISTSASDKVRGMIHEARATFHAGSDTPGYYTGGKTGTSQTLRDGKYIDSETVGTYLGFGGNDSSSKGPKYVIMVQVSGKNMNLTGSTDAMPIFTDISNWTLDYMKLQPKG